MRPVLAFAFMATTLFAAGIPNLVQLEKMTARFTPAEYKVDTSQLSPGDRAALVKLVAAARVVNAIFLDQMWSGNRALYARLKQDHTALGQARLHYFWLNKGPWSEIDGNAAFLPDAPPQKLPGANFYPEDMTRAEFEAWEKTLSKHDTAQAQGFFTVIRRGPDRKLTIVPYSKEYAKDLRRAAALLRDAAALTSNASLKRFLDLRAAALLSDDYRASDVAWMDLNAPIDVTYGPYETYNDQIFGYKAAFEAYIHLRDDAETAKVKFFAGHLQEVENNLPIDARYRNPKLGSLSPIRVVNQIFGAGDGAHGVQTAAYNLPNDEAVVREKGSKQVLMRNVQEAKFNQTLVPISKRVLAPRDFADLSFDAFFTHILAHELSHGIGPHEIHETGRDTTPRKELKELYSAIEEAKADVTGLFLLQYLMDRGLIPGGAAVEHRLYTTYLASSFRTLRFGLNEAHGKGMAVQLRFLTQARAIIEKPDGTFAVDFTKMKAAVRDLDHALLTIEAQGDYGGAKRLFEASQPLSPAMRKALAGLGDIPTDIEPVFVTADELSRSR